MNWSWTKLGLKDMLKYHLFLNIHAPHPCPVAPLKRNGVLLVCNDQKCMCWCRHLNWVRIPFDCLCFCESAPHQYYMPTLAEARVFPVGLRVARRARAPRPQTTKVQTISFCGDEGKIDGRGGEGGVLCERTTQENNRKVRKSNMSTHYTQLRRGWGRSRVQDLTWNCVSNVFNTRWLQLTATVTGKQLDWGGGKMTPLNGLFRWPI